MPNFNMITFYVITALSHCLFGMFSIKLRFNKVITSIIYSIYFILFILWCLLPIPLSIKFGGSYIVYFIIYIIATKNNILKKLFVLSTYTIIITILFGLLLAIKLLTYEEFKILQLIMIIISYIIVQVIIYKFFLPKFRKIESKILSGWTQLIIGNVLFFILLFIQTIYPYNLTLDEPFRIVIFLISTCIYIFIYNLIFFTFNTVFNYTINKEENKHLTELAYKDSLTNLLNKTSYDAHIKLITNEATKGNVKETSVIVIDINKFKSINDNYGHLIGDEVLKNVASVIKDVFNGELNYAFRFGGDEFVVISQTLTINDINEKLMELNKQLVEKENRVTVSAGYSFVDFKNIDAIQTAFKNADKYMYKTKYNK